MRGSAAERSGRLALAGLLGLLLFAANCDRRPPREVVIVARGMAFVLADQPHIPNPVIRLESGERVRLVLRNEAPGLLHDLEIPAWSITIARLRAGESGSVTFTVPLSPGRYEYRCRPHAELMHGFVEVLN